MLVVTGIAAALFVAIHLFIGKLKFLNVMPRSLWLSFAGGCAVAYVFAYLLPRIAGEHAALLDLPGMGLVRNPIWLVAMTGLVVFYGLELLVQKNREEREEEGLDDTSSGVFWVHIGAFGLYNLLIGLLLVQRYGYGLRSFLFYVAAIAFHFVSNDFGLRDEHEEKFEAKGRWILSAAIVAGWLIGLSLPLPPWLTAVAFAFLAGGIILNVLKEELPEKRESSFMPFLVGVAAFSGLLLAL